MKNKLTIAMAVLVMAVMNQSVCAQDSVRATPVVKVSLFYTNHLHYYGRTDGASTAALIPMAEVWMGRHVYVNAAPVFIQTGGQSGQYAGTVATAGVQWNREKSFTHVFVVKPFYKDNSNLPQSVLKAQVNASHTRKNDIINITVGADLKFSDQVDYGLTLGLDHLFRKDLGKVVLLADPSLYVYGGTQRFTKTWYERQKFLFLEGPEQAFSKSVNRFNLLSWEASLPVILSRGPVMLIVSPAYVEPLNLLAGTTDGGPAESGKKAFYVTAGARISF